MACDPDHDLPLVSNIEDVVVRHYMFYFSCNFKKQNFLCSAVLFLEPVICTNETPECKCLAHNSDNASGIDSSDTYPKNNFVLVLDCYKMNVCSIEEIGFNADAENLKYKEHNPKSFNSKCGLRFESDKWSLKIWKEDCFCKFCFPKTIRIHYVTSPNGLSLLWVRDQDKKQAVFTYGAWVNNRSLFPCQEPPSAMATWEATVDVDNSAIVLMSGDEDAKTHSENGRTQYYYFTRCILPLSTLCLAVGSWQEHVISSKIKCGPKCRIFSPSSLLDKSIQELFEYVPYCLAISEDIFGTYPFPRIDFLIVPPTFGSLGMASPNIIFLSQSLLIGDSSMSARIAHEIAHGWFGLLIGALDWTEEWLSEGFATFVEDYLHVKTLNMCEKTSSDYIQVKTYIRLKTLLQEISNSDEELQLLKGKTFKEEIDGVSATVLKNGQNPVKAFMQVHYIKGYFLLKHLAEIVGYNNFFMFLRGYIEKYQGELVTSNDFLVYFFNSFPEVNSQVSLDKIHQDWFANPDVIPELKSMKPPAENALYALAMNATRKFIAINNSYLKQKHKKNKLESDFLLELPQEAMIIFLENLLDESKISKLTIKLLSESYNSSKANAEVQHRWFELIVKYHYKPEYEGLRKFLTDHLAMGVYLFNEMLFSKDKLLQNLAKEVYFELKPVMEPNYIRTIEDMLKSS